PAVGMISVADLARVPDESTGSSATVPYLSPLAYTNRAESLAHSGNLAMHRADDQLLNARPPGAWMTVVDHRRVPFVAPLLQHAERRDVRQHVVDVAGNPDFAELLFETQRVIDDDFAAQRHPG